MIKLPIGKPIYRQLRARFTSFPGLMEFLEEEEVTGYLELESWEGSGKIILNSGEVTHVVLETIEGRVEGDVALSRIKAQAEKPDCVIDVYELPGAFTDLVKEFCHAELIYYHLDSRFTDVEKLVNKLIDQRHFGLVEVEFEKLKQTGIIYMHHGKVLKTQLVTESKKRTHSRDYSVKRLLQLTRQREGFINVYKVHPSESEKEVLPSVGSGKRHLSEPRAGSREHGLRQYQGLVKNIGELFTKLELVVSKLRKNFDFNYHLRKIQLELADEYPFLDPFAGEIEYRRNRMELLVLPANEDSFLQGLGNLVTRVIDSVAPIVPQGVMDNMVSQYSDVFQKLNIGGYEFEGQDGRQG